MRVSEIEKVVLTSDKSLYDSVPRLDEYRFRGSNVYVRLLDLEFGRTYYMLYRNRLIAFRPLLCNLFNNLWLLETPEGLVWDGLGSVPIFSSKEHYFRYLEGVSDKLEIPKVSIGGVLLGLHCCGQPLFGCGNVRDCSYYTNYCSYEWDSKVGRPKSVQSKLDIAFISCDGIFINIYKDKEVFPSYSECVKDSLDGMEVIEFGSSVPCVSVRVSEVSCPIVHTLKFVEL